jgi:hypothetical protein
MRLREGTTRVLSLPRKRSSSRVLMSTDHLPLFATSSITKRTQQLMLLINSIISPKKNWLFQAKKHSNKKRRFLFHQCSLAIRASHWLWSTLNSNQLEHQKFQAATSSLLIRYMKKSKTLMKRTGAFQRNCTK